MRKIGHFLFTFVPLVLYLLLQTAALLLVGTIRFFFLLRTDTDIASLDANELTQRYISICSDGTTLTGCFLLYSTLAILLFGIWYVKKYVPAKTERQPLRTKIHPLMLVAIPLLAIGLQYITGFLIGILSLLQPQWVEHYQSILESAGFYNGSIWISLYLVICAPINEELVFRGVTFSHARRHMPFWIANVIQAALFGLMHQNMVQGLYAFGIGLCLGYICMRGGSLFFSTLLHICFNFIATLQLDLTVIFGTSSFGSGCLLLVTLLCTAGGMLLFLEGVKRR